MNSFGQSQKNNVMMLLFFREKQSRWAMGPQVQLYGILTAARI